MIDFYFSFCFNLLMKRLKVASFFLGNKLKQNFF